MSFKIATSSRPSRPYTSTFVFPSIHIFASKRGRPGTCSTNPARSPVSFASIASISARTNVSSAAGGASVARSQGQGPSGAGAEGVDAPTKSTRDIFLEVGTGGARAGLPAPAPATEDESAGVSASESSDGRYWLKSGTESAMQTGVRITPGYFRGNWEMMPNKRFKVKAAS